LAVTVESQATTQPFQEAMDLIRDWAAQAAAVVEETQVQQPSQAVAVAKSLALSMERLFHQASPLLKQHLLSLETGWLLEPQTAAQAARA